MESNKILIRDTIKDDLHKVIAIERANPEFIGQFNLEEHEKVIFSTDGLHLSIFEKASGELVGYIILFGFDDPNDAIEFRRIAIAKKGLGCGKDAVRIIQKLCFAEHKKHRLHLSVFTDNDIAFKLYESLGFKNEGLSRECIKSGDGFRSLWKMSMLESEYNTDA